MARKTKKMTVNEQENNYAYWMEIEDMDRPTKFRELDETLEFLQDQGMLTNYGVTFATHVWKTYVREKAD